VHEHFKHFLMTAYVDCTITVQCFQWARPGRRVVNQYTAGNTYDNLQSNEYPLRLIFIKIQFPISLEIFLQCPLSHYRTCPVGVPRFPPAADENQVEFRPPVVPYSIPVHSSAFKGSLPIRQRLSDKVIFAAENTLTGSALMAGMV
jgi:hypothetical protein